MPQNSKSFVLLLGEQGASNDGSDFRVSLIHVGTPSYHTAFKAGNGYPHSKLSLSGLLY